MDADGNLVAARSAGVESSERTATGSYLVFLSGSTAGCNAVATSSDAGLARVRAIDDAANTVRINTYALVDGSSYTRNDILDRGFHLQVAC